MSKIVPDYLNGWKLVPDEEAEGISVTSININTDLNDVEPIGLYENSEEVLRTLEKLFNDFTMRREEEQALDWAIRFIKAHTKTGLEKMVADCERHVVCKGCPHEKECE